jgi:2-polyprenyl-6-hydroxyphenyl methylase/3-demethylubiquinone-9 3-methyltransferase
MHAAPLPDYVIGAYPDIAAYRQSAGALRLSWQHAGEAHALVLARHAAEGLRGHCAGCGRVSTFRIEAGPADADGAAAQPNWRETLACECGLINRIRASIQVFRDFSAPAADARIYATERVTALFAWLAQSFPNAVGSEYLGPEAESGRSYPRGSAEIRHEDVTRLSFDDASLDHVLSFDVLEHVPDYRAALGEFARVLCGGGTLLLSAPFDLEAPETVVRARITAEGGIEHLLEPQYHGDPIAPGAGVLCYQIFGWSLLDDLRAAGFEDVRLTLVWSLERGYLGWGNVFVHARRVADGPRSARAASAANTIAPLAARLPPLSSRPRVQELMSWFRDSGHTDEEYLRTHYPRFRRTLELFEQDWDPRRGERVLDVGAHWLHQAAMWAAAGYRVTAMDLPGTFETDAVRAVAGALGIRLLVNPSLEHPAALGTLPDDSFDVILLTEVIEHLAFNPIELWREIHRVLAPGGRILLTTPNAYRLRGQAWRPRRFLAGRGFGIPVEQILGIRTLGHHWKEYSRKELHRYFAILSPDFMVSRALYVPDLSPAAMGLRVRLERMLPFLREHLHLEIDLREKRVGITCEARW